MKLSHPELRELMRMHMRAMMEEFPATHTSVDLQSMSVADMTARIEPHLNRLCELFSILKYDEPKEKV